ncbi:MAG: hypothetical protein ACR2KB_16965 [Chitinophagaceae bacterium]
MGYRKLYEAVGYLFHSIAFADKKITIPETNALTNAVKEKWVSIEKGRDAFGTDEAHYISITFDYLAESEMPVDESWEYFENYFNENKELFTPELKNLIYSTSHSIANATASISKSESDLLMHLKKLLNIKTT